MPLSVNNTNLVERLRAALVVKFEIQLQQLESEVLSEVLKRHGHADIFPEICIEEPNAVSDIVPALTNVSESESEFKGEVIPHEMPETGHVSFSKDKVGLETALNDKVAGPSPEYALPFKTGGVLRRKTGRHAHIVVRKINGDRILLDRQIRWPGAKRRTHILRTEIDAFLNEYVVIQGGAS